jgi:hypothetical protein
MADSSEARSGLAVFLQKKASKRLMNTLFNVMPTLEFMFALSGDKTGPLGLGRPKTDILKAARGSVADAQRLKIMVEREYKPIIQTTKPSKTEVKSMTDYDNDPSVPAWETTNATLGRFKQPRFKFARKKMPYKVAHSEVRTARDSARTEGEAAAAIGSVYNAEVMTREAVLCELLNDCLWGINGQSGAPTDEDAVVWDNFHSIKNALKADNTYGGIDRSVSSNSFWRGNYSTTNFAGTFEDLINYCNYDLGMLKKGLGVQMIGVGGQLMKRAKAEARSKGTRCSTTASPTSPSTASSARSSASSRATAPSTSTTTRRSRTRIRATRPTKSVCLDPSTWTVAFGPDGNFKHQYSGDQTKVEAATKRTRHDQRRADAGMRGPVRKRVFHRRRLIGKRPDFQALSRRPVTRRPPAA